LAFKVWTFAAYEVAWFACVLGAAHGMPWLGPWVTAFFALVHLAWVPDRLREACLMAMCAAFGFGIDSLNGYLGAVVYHPGGFVPWFAPPWLIAIWVAFALTLHGCMEWLQSRMALTALLGAIGGPLVYLGGARLGAVGLGPDFTWDMVIVAAAWAIAAPVLVVFARLTRWDSSGSTSLQPE